MSNAFIDKLCAHVALSADDIALLEAECASARDVPARYDLIREGDASGPLFVILEGWACRYQILPEGSRQITAFLMPGDCCLGTPSPITAVRCISASESCVLTEWKYGCMLS